VTVTPPVVPIAPPITTPAPVIVAPPVVPIAPPITTPGTAALTPPIVPVAPRITTPAAGVFGAKPLSATQERGLKAKESFKECDNCPEVVVVPAGSFTMGASHRVTFSRRFAAGMFPVTFDEWDACVAGGGCNGYRPPDQGFGRGKRPVINVSWHDAKAYVAWLSKKTGKTYRLLSEAEREYVTRADTTTPYWWGHTIATNQAKLVRPRKGCQVQGRVPGEDAAGRVLLAEPLGTLPGAWQRVGLGRGLLE
jgi:hypothetical protein